MIKNSVFAASIALSLVMAGIASAAVTNRHRVVSYMFGPSAEFARATYEQCRIDGVQCREFSLVVLGAAPNKSTAVFVDGRKIGTLRTNGMGVGKLKYQTAAFIESSSVKPIAANFRRVDPGQAIRMGRMGGVFFDSIHDDEVQEVEVEGEFNNDRGEVEYSEEFEDNSIEREFVLEFQGAAPCETLNITVNGAVVFTTTADENGEVELVLVSPSANEDDDEGDDEECDDEECEDDDAEDENEGDAQSMPDSFPSIQVGDVVGIGDVTVVMGAENDDDDDEEDEDCDEAD